MAPSACSHLPLSSRIEMCGIAMEDDKKMSGEMKVDREVIDVLKLVLDGEFTDQDILPKRLKMNTHHRHLDVDINTNFTSTPTNNQIPGPITRAHAHQLNNQVSSFLASYSSYLDTGNVYSVLLLRKDG
jgi:hypothetical protein